MTETAPQTQPHSAALPEGIDAANVSRFLAAHVPDGDGPLSAEMIAGGRSNLTYVIRTPGGEWILRRPPLGHVLPTAHDMAREFRVIAALAGSDVPVPRAIALCEDPAVSGAPFYIMSRCEGVVVGQDWPEGYATPAGVEADRARLSAALVETLAQLHAVDYQTAGLGDFGRPEGFLERQVRRWGQQWARSQTRDVPAVDEVARRLAGAIPPSPPATIVHGDYRASNTMLAHDDPGRIVAVLDWEMATIGDPLTDLGLLLCYWTHPDDPPLRLTAAADAGATTRLPGFWRREQVIAEYGRRSGRPLDALDFYEVFGLYKLAVITEGIHTRFLTGGTRGEGFDTYAGRSAAFAETALDVAGRSELRALRG